jgi:type I restriction enzyme M protein
MSLGKLTFDALKSHLWAAADILRGSLDANEYRQPIMTLLFLKRLNDQFEERAEQLEKKGKLGRSRQTPILCSKADKME